jgi:hypothetical protein
MRKFFEVLFFVGVCFSSFAQESQTSGDFKFIIKGEGISRTITIIDYTGTDAVVEIPAVINDILVTEIGSPETYGGMQGINSLIEIILPDTVEGIGPLAFFGSRNLKRINIPKNLTKIGWSAFYLQGDGLWAEGMGLDKSIQTELLERFGRVIFESPW